MQNQASDTVKKVESILQRGQVISDDKSLQSYVTSSPHLKKGANILCVARPADPEELRELVRGAVENGLKLVPLSSSAPHCKGGISCREEHVLVDLSSWNKILRIDRRNRVAMIEPGVTYGELLDALEQHGMTVSMPLAPRSGKSVVAAVLDREPSTWPNKQWDIGDPLGCIEFIFGTGDLFRTGAAGGPGTLEHQRKVGGAQKAPLGPSQTDFHRVLQGSQGSMGMVTWMTIRTELKPSIQEPRLISAEELEQLITLIYEVQRPWLGEHCYILNKTAAAMLMTNQAPDSFSKVKDALPEFICLINIAGFERRPRERVEYQLRDIQQMASRNKLKLSESQGPVTAKEILDISTWPCGEADWRQALKGQCLSIFFLSTLDRAPSFIKVFKEAANKIDIAEDTIGVYLQPVVQNHACHLEFMVPFDLGDQSAVEKIKHLEKAAVNELASNGAFFSRPYGTAELTAFQTNQLNTEVLKKIKNIFDPGRVLNPGKFGI